MTLSAKFGFESEDAFSQKCSESEEVFHGFPEISAFTEAKKLSSGGRRERFGASEQTWVASQGASNGVSQAYEFILIHDITVQWEYH